METGQWLLESVVFFQTGDISRCVWIVRKIQTNTRLGFELPSWDCSTHSSSLSVGEDYFSSLPWLVFSVFDGGRCCLWLHFHEKWGLDPSTLEKYPLSNHLYVPVSFHMQQVLGQRWVQVKTDTQQDILLCLSSLCGVAAVTQCHLICLLK